MRYQRLFDYLPAEGEICRVRTAEFVTTEDGTGIVHIAPAYGEDDLRLGQAHGLPVVHGVGEDGYFLEAVEPVGVVVLNNLAYLLEDLSEMVPDHVAVTDHHTLRVARRT